MFEISVIIPVYNKKKYLADILNDLITQSFSEFECILIDDGSTDGSAQICDEFAKLDKRFTVIHIPNGGVSHARNLGIKYAQGEYITFVDSDDRIHRDYLQNLYNCIKNNNVDLVIGNHQKVWEDASIKEEGVVPYKGEKNIQEILSSFAKVQKETGLFGFCWAKIFKRELVSTIRFDEKLKLAEDFEFYLKLYKKINSIYFDDKPYYYYLQQAENSSSIIEDEKIDYVAQLNINLKYRIFLKYFNAYSGENKTIVEQILNNYVYFSIFYCSIQQITIRCEQLYEIVQESQINLKGYNKFSTCILFLLNKQYYSAIKMVIYIYRILRKLIRGRT